MYWPMRAAAAASVMMIPARRRRPRPRLPPGQPGMLSYDTLTSLRRRQPPSRGRDSESRVTDGTLLRHNLENLTRNRARGRRHNRP